MIDDSGKLTVNINGDMADYSEGKAPWYGYADQITAIHIGSGCTNVGRNGFYGLSEVTAVTGGENVEACAMYSFEECGKMIPEIYLPKCTYLGECSFRGCGAVRIVLPVVEEVRAKAFCGSPYLVQIDLGSKIKEIGVMAFSECPQMWVDYSPNIFMSNPTPPKLYTKVEASTAAKVKDFFRKVGHALGIAASYVLPAIGGGVGYLYGYFEADEDTGGSPYLSYFKTGNDAIDKYYNPFAPKPDGEGWTKGEPIICVPTNLVATYRDYYADTQNLDWSNYGYIDDDTEGMGVNSKYKAGHGAIMAGGKIGSSISQGWWMQAKRNENNEVVFEPNGEQDALVVGGDLKTTGMAAVNAEKSWAKSLFIGANTIPPDAAFQGWTNLEYVYIAPKTWISFDMFKGCTNLEKVDAHANSLGASAFEGCTKLSSFRGGSEIRNVEAKAFKGCTSLFQVVLPEVKTIQQEAFMNCPKLRYLYSSGNNGSKLSSQYDIETIGESAFEGCEALNDISLQNVKELGKRAFYGSGIDEFSPSPYFSLVPEEAFASSKIVRIKINGAHQLSFGPKSFANTNLTINFDVKERGIFVDNSDYSRISTVASDAFAGLELKDIPLHCSHAAQDVYKKDEILGQMLFKPYDVNFLQWSVEMNGWELTSSGILTVGRNQLFGIYHDSPEKYPWYPYRDLIKKVIVEDGASTIYTSEFEGLTRVTDVHIPRTVKNIKEAAFRGCTALKNIYITRVEYIGNYAFEGCTSLKEIELDENLKNAGDYIFKGCTSLTDITNKEETPATVTNLTFASIGSDTYQSRRNAKGKAAETNAVNLHVPRAAVLNYMIDENWNKLHIAYADDRGTWAKAGKFGDGAWILYDDGTMVVCADKGMDESSYESLYYDAYSAMRSLNFAKNPDHPQEDEPMLLTKRLEIDGNISSLGEYFNNFKNLEEVVVKAPIHKYYATFRGCEKLASINLAQADTVEYMAFQGTALTNVAMPNAKFVGQWAFQNCKQLKTVQLGESSKISSEAFMNCTALAKADLGGATFGDKSTGIFKGCAALSGVIFHGRKVVDNMFEGCAALEEIDLGDQLNSVGKNAFGGCTALKSIYVSSPTPPILYANAFAGTSDETKVDHKQIELQVPNSFIVAYTSSTLYAWHEMKIVMDEDYVEDLLPTGGSLRTSGSSWTLDTEGTLTLDADGEIVQNRSNGRPFDGPDIWAYTFTPWLYFIRNIVVTDNVTDLPAYMFDSPWATTGDISNASAGVKTVTLGEKVKSVGAYTLPFSGLTDVYVYNEAWVEFDANCFDHKALAANNATLHLVKTLPDNLFTSYKGWVGTRAFPNIVRDLEPIDPKVQAVSFPVAELSMRTGQTINLYDLGVQFTPANVKNTKLRFNNLLTSANVNIDDDGNMRANWEGKAYIEAYSSYTTDGQEVQATWGPEQSIYLIVTITEPSLADEVFFDYKEREGTDAPWITCHVLKDEYVDADTYLRTCEIAGPYNEDEILTPAIPEWRTGSMIIPENADGFEVVRIGARSFYERELTAVWIPWTVTQIGESAFARCYYLTDVFIPSYTPLQFTNDYGETDENLWNNHAFERIGEGDSGEGYATLHVPAGSKAAWDIYPWNEWFRYIVEDAPIPDGIGSITPDASPMRVENWFDLSGRKLGDKPMKAGLYIRNGKKVVIK